MTRQEARRLATRVALVVLVPLVTWGVVSEVTRHEHATRIATLEKDATRRDAKLDAILEALAELRVAVGRLDERVGRTK